MARGKKSAGAVQNYRAKRLQKVKDAKAEYRNLFTSHSDGGITFYPPGNKKEKKNKRCLTEQQEAGKERKLMMQQLNPNLGKIKGNICKAVRHGYSIPLIPHARVDEQYPLTYEREILFLEHTIEQSLEMLRLHQTTGRFSKHSKDEADIQMRACQKKEGRNRRIEPLGSGVNSDVSDWPHLSRTVNTLVRSALDGFCKPCNILYRSEERYSDHIKTRQHKRRAGSAGQNQTSHHPVQVKAENIKSETVRERAVEIGNPSSTVLKREIKPEPSDHSLPFLPPPPDLMRELRLGLSNQEQVEEKQKNGKEGVSALLTALPADGSLACDACNYTASCRKTYQLHVRSILHARRAARKLQQEDTELAHQRQQREQDQAPVKRQKW